MIPRGAGNMQTLTTAIHARTLTVGNRFLNRDGQEEVVRTNKQGWFKGLYVGDNINGVWYSANEIVRLVVGGSTSSTTFC